MDINIIEFCEIYEIKWQPINLKINPETNKKILSKCFCKDGFSFMPQPDDFTKNIISDDELKKRQSYYNQFDYIAVDTCDFYHIDVDDNKYIDKVEDLMKICPYFLSSTKNYHTSFIKVKKNIIKINVKLYTNIIMIMVILIQLKYYLVYGLIVLKIN